MERDLAVAGWQIPVAVYSRIVAEAARELAEFYRGTKDHVTLITIAETDRSNVYRMGLGSKHKAILKMSRDEASVLREQGIHTCFVGSRTVVMPVVLAAGTVSGVGWILYEEGELTSPRWTRHRWLKVGELTARIHQHRWQTYGTLPSLASHTPALSAILESVSRSHPVDVMGELQRFVRLTPRHRWVIRRVWDYVVHWQPQELASVYCHGDLHLGNVLWSSAEHRFHAIDWSFFHADSPLFDVFQTLDATSPFAPVRRYGRRLEYLQAYYAANPELAVSFQRFVREYRRYAAAHLVWILIRIAGDMKNERFERSALQRQTVETLAALQGLLPDGCEG